MEIQITHEPAKVLHDTVVVIDVFTFSTTASILLSKGAKEFCVLGWGNEDSFALQERLNAKDARRYLLIDDTVNKIDEAHLRANGHPMPIFFDHGMAGRAYAEYSILYRSQNGTQAVDQTYSERRTILVGSFVNFDSTLDYLKKRGGNVTLFVCGSKGQPNSDDLVCARYYQHFLEWGRDEDRALYRMLLREMVASNDPGDFFEKYIDTPYGNLLGFNVQLNTVPGVVHAERKEAEGRSLYLLTRADHG